MEAACPVSGKKVNETVVRLVALFVFIVVVATCFTKFFPIIALALAVDFFIRALAKPNISAFALTAGFIARTLKLPAKAIDAAPKVFAAKVGFCITAMIAVLGFMKLTSAVLVVTGILAVCAFLEAFLSVCVGCFLYSILKSVKVIKS